jgi:NAD(P)-dependent dehydrogenase (short-subunit alcohol dehydrogenase family)
MTSVLLAAGGGRIVNISVKESTMTRAGFVPYGPSRAGTESLSRIMAADLDNPVYRTPTINYNVIHGSDKSFIRPIRAPRA